MAVNLDTSNSPLSGLIDYQRLVLGPLLEQSKVLPHLRVIQTGSAIVHIPTGKAAAAGWFAENAEITQSDDLIDEIVVTPRKCASLAVVSELAADTSPGAVDVVGGIIVNSVANAVDRAFFAGTGVAPQPLGIASVVGVSTATGLTVDGIADAIAEIEDAGGSASVIWANPADWSTLVKALSDHAAVAPTGQVQRNVLGVPVETTSAVTAGTIWQVPPGGRCPNVGRGGVAPVAGSRRRTRGKAANRRGGNDHFWGGNRLVLTCERCGAALSPRPGPGRPRRFCQNRCRRAAGAHRRAREQRLADLRAVVEGRAPWWVTLTRAQAAAELALTRSQEDPLDPMRDYPHPNPDISNLTCLAAGRHEVLRRAGWDVERDGLTGAPRVRVYAGAERHETVDRALRLLGLGTGAVVEVAADAQGRLRPEALAAALRPGPAIVCLQAGNVNTGAVDPLRPACTIAHEAGAWVHVDGAFGLWAAAAPARRHLVDGVELADSWATDAHKWLNVPYDSGLAFTAHPAAHRAAMGMTAAYLPPAAEARDEVDWNPELSRRARGFAVWAVLRSLGRSGVADVVERCCALAALFARLLRAEPGVEVGNEVVLNQVLVRFGSDERTSAVTERVQQDGTCWVGPTRFQGRTWMRISVSNATTREEDVVRSVRAIVHAATAAPTRS
ncbi:MAG TPA: phage major capsid protein [Mycobacteriales bacterium]|nr:phage major capsid protein [Mycobacteriales bacterium]